MGIQTTYMNQRSSAGSFGISAPRKIPRQKLDVVYVGNLPAGKSQHDLLTLFRNYGDVESVMLLTDAESNSADQFGWVFMGQAGEAVKALDDIDLEGRRLCVKKMGILYPNK